MPDFDSAALSGVATDERIDLEPRDVRALTRCVSVLPNQPEVRGADEMFLVVSESGSEYTVDLRTGSCSCPDAMHRDPEGGCYHVRRARYATGRREIPAWIDSSAVDDGLGQHTEGGPRVAATDGGVTPIEGDEPHPSNDENDDSEECICSSLPDDVPCFECYKDGAEFD